MKTEDVSPKGKDKESSLNFYSEELEAGIFQLVISLTQAKIRETGTRTQAFEDVINYLDSISTKMKEEIK